MIQSLNFDGLIFSWRDEFVTCIFPWELDASSWALLKGTVHQFWIYNIFLVSQQKKHFLYWVHLDKTTLTRSNWEKWCSMSVRVIYIIYITVFGQTDFEHHIFSVISRRSCSIEIYLLLKMFHSWRHEKNVIYSNLVSNPFTRDCSPILNI